MTKLPFETVEVEMVMAAPAFPAAATLVHMLVLMPLLLRVPNRRQPVTPAGVPTVAVVLDVNARMRPSPGCTEAGTTTRCDVVLALAAAWATNVIADPTGADTAMSRLAEAVVPLLSVTETVTGYVPSARYVCEAVGPLAVDPSSKVHDVLAMVPSGSLEVEVNEHDRPVHDEAKPAVGDWFAGGGPAGGTTTVHMMALVDAAVLVAVTAGQDELTAAASPAAALMRPPEVPMEVARD